MAEEKDIEIEVETVTLKEFIEKHEALFKAIENKPVIGNEVMISRNIQKVIEDPRTKFVSIQGARLKQELGFQMQLKLLCWFVSGKIRLKENSLWGRLSGGWYDSLPGNVKEEIFKRKIHIVSIVETEFSASLLGEIENSL